MASEASAVIVAVRVRPFSGKEDPLTCTVTVPDSTTINVVDVGSVLQSVTNPSGANTNSSSTAGTGTHTSSGGSGGSIGDSTSGPAKHAFAFDKVFWSIPPDVLPVHGPFLAEALAGHASVPPSRKDSMLSTATLSASVRDSTGLSSSPSTSSLASSAGPASVLSKLGASVAQQLPCLHYPPDYDDQASVYEYIGPKLYEAVMSGFNACLFAYGQTGSGKSYSMIGEHLSSAAALVKKGTVPRTSQGRELGIMPRLSADLFALMREEREKDESVSYTVELSFLEIYCEKVRDLLAGTPGTHVNTTGGSGPTSGPTGLTGAANGGGGTALPSGTPATATSTSASYFSPASTGASLRVRQHPSRGPYVEGLSHVRVRDAEAVVKYLVSGLRDRATAGTKMNEHSSRSHAILQLHITKVTVVSDDGGVLTRTRTCKVNLVDLAGSERVTQSGVTGERFEEARNINQSLSTLGRVIQQLSDKQAGKRVIPAYRDSVLTWLLSDSLGGNSKTIMLATVAPSAYCYAQTLNTLRFAGVAKKIINVATVNEDRQYQQVIADLRQQIVRLTLQLESGKASEVHSAEIHSLKAQREELLKENHALKSREAGVADPQTILALRKRISELEDANTQLRTEKVNLQQKMLQTSSSLREELAASRAETLRLHSQLSKKEAEAADWQSRYRAAQRPNAGSVSPLVIAGGATDPALNVSVSGPGATGAGGGGGGLTGASTPGISAREGAGHAANRANTATLSPSPAKRTNNTTVVSAIEASLSGQSTFIAGDTTAAQRQLQEDVAKLKKQLATVKSDLKSAKHAADENKDSARMAQKEVLEFRQKYEACQRELDVLQERMECTTALLETTQLELARARRSMEPATANAQKSAEEAVTLAAQLAQTREDYLKEKRGNVQLLLRVSQLEQGRSQFKKEAAERRADINELEQLMLEETETSERYYLRMRYHRTISELQKHFTSKIAFAAERGQHAAMVAAASRRGSVRLSGTPSPANNHADPSSPASRSPRGGHDGQSDAVSGPISPASSTAVERLLAQSAAATANSYELMFAQLEYECMSDEAYQRGALEQEYMHSTIRLLAQKARLRQAQLEHLEELLVEARDQLSLATEQSAFFRTKATDLETRVAELESREVERAEDTREGEAQRQQLERELEAAEERVAELETYNTALVQKLAEAQAARDTTNEKCAELESMLSDAQDALLQWQQAASPSPTTTGASATTSRAESVHGDRDDVVDDLGHNNDGADEDEEAMAKHARRQSRRANSVFDVKAVIHLKDKELAAALHDVQRLEAQCETYRNELGAANALREKEMADRQNDVLRVRQELDLVQEKLEHAVAEKKRAEEEAAAATRDYEHRIDQQQAMLTTLRQSLEEESRTADECRNAAQQADAKVHSLQQDLNTAQEANALLQQQHQLVEARYAVVQKELEELRAHYAILEGQLMELRKNEPELYVMLERGLAEDTAAWLEKVKREKANLQKQKQDARQLNSELLAHIRNRNSHLRDVQRQLTEITETSVNASRVTDELATGGARPTALDGTLGDITDIQTDDSLPSSIHSTPATSPASAR